MDSCPPLTRLRQLLANELKPSESKALEDHINACPECQLELHRLCDIPETENWRRLLADEVAIAPRNGSFAFDPPPLLHDRAERATIRFPGPATASGPLGQLGTYQIQKELGAGASGIVFLAFDDRLRRSVAIKVLRPELAVNSDSGRRFEREARHAVAVRHEHIVTIHQVGEAADFSLPYLVMEFIDGETLSGRLHRLGRLTPAEAATLIRQVVSGLSYAHERGLVHRDIKPSNILIDSVTGKAKLGDFGIARVNDEGDGHANGERFTRTGQIIGTPSYMSPEQVVSPSQVDARSDIYSIGVVLYEMLCGEPPFSGNAHNILQRVVHEEPASLASQRTLRIPRDLETIASKCMAKAPARRYPNARELGADLNRWLQGDPIRARPTSSLERTIMWSRRHPWVAGFWSLLACALLSILAITWRSNHRLSALLGEVLTQKSIAERLGRQATKQSAVVEAQLEKSLSVLQRESIRSAERLLRHRRDADAVRALNLVPRERRGWEWDRMAYEAALSDPPKRVVGLHEWGVSAMLVSADDRWIVSAGEDGRLIRWDLGTGASFDLGGGSWSKARRAWRHVLVPMREDEPANALASDCILALAWADHGKSLVAGSLTGKATIRPGQGGEAETLFDHARPLNVVASSPDDRTLIFGDDKGSLILYDRATRKANILDLLKGSAILDLVPAGKKHLVTGQEDGTLTLVDLETKLVADRLALRGPIWDIDVAADGKSVAIACGEAQLQTFSVDESDGRLRREQTYTLPIPDQLAEHVVLQAVRFSPDGSRIAGADSQGRIVVWDASDHEPSVILSSSTGDRTAGDDRDKFPTSLKRRICGLRFSADGNTLFTADLDSSIRRIELQVPGSHRGTTEFSVGAAPIVRFDAIRPRNLWVACADGTLAIWDSVSREKLESVTAHDGPIIGLEVATRADIAVTVGQDRAIRFWKANGAQIDPIGPSIRHEKPIRTVSLTSDAVRMAAYDSDNLVTLWDVASGRKIQSYLMQDEKPSPTLTGLVAFNPNGKILAIAGPGQTCSLVDGETLGNPRPIDMFAGRGGTALAWHPLEIELLMGGDSVGRVHSDFPTGTLFLPPERNLTSPIRGLGFTPRGDRVVAAASDGKLVIIDPRWIGGVLNLRSADPDLTDARFDMTGRRLALAHRGGRVVVWETAPPPRDVAARVGRSWKESVLLETEDAKRPRFATSPATLDAEGRVCFLFVSWPNPSVEPTRRTITLGRETSRGFHAQVVEDVGEYSDLTIGGLLRSLSLLHRGEDLFTTHRRNAGTTKAQLVLLRLHASSDSGSDRSTDLLIERTELLEKPGEAGIDTRLILDNNRHPSVLHFDHDGHFLRWTKKTGGHWSTETIGHRGDGYNSTMARDDQESLHIAFTPMRPGGNDPSPLTYLNVPRTDREQEGKREIVDPSRLPSGIVVPQIASLAIGPQQSPHILYDRRGKDGRRELVIAHREPSGWVPQVIIEDAPPMVSNLTCDCQGVFRFAFCAQDGRRLLLATGTPEGWRYEEIGNGMSRQADAEKSWEPVTIQTLLDDHDRPVVVVTANQPGKNSLRVFRPVP